MPVWRTNACVIAGLCAPVYLAVSALPTAFDWGLLLIAGAGAWLFGRGRPCPALLAPSTDRLVLAFLAVWVATCLFSIDRARSLYLSMPLIPATLLYLVVSRHYRQRETRTVMAVGFALLAMGFAAWLGLHRVAGAAADPQALVDAGGSLLLVVPNDGLLIAAAALFALPLIDDGARLAAPGLAALLAAFACTWLLESRSMALALLAGLGAAGWLRGGRWWRVAATALPLLVLAVDWSLGMPLLGKFQGAFDNRLVLWLSAGEVFTEHPWLGAGPHTFALTHDPGAVTDLGHSLDPRSMPWPHNAWLETLAAGGLLLAAALAALWIHALVAVLRMHATGPRPWLAGAWVLLSVTGLLETSFLRLWWVVVLFVFLGAIAALNHEGKYPCPQSS